MVVYDLITINIEFVMKKSIKTLTSLVDRLTIRNTTTLINSTVMCIMEHGVINLDETAIYI